MSKRLLHAAKLASIDALHRSLGQSRADAERAIAAIKRLEPEITPDSLKACRDPIRQTRGQLSGLHQTRIYLHLITC
jgi:hypothetical protein